MGIGGPWRVAPDKAPVMQHSLEYVAKYIKSPLCNNIVVLTGAGVSCAAGIPDFRSPGGMFTTLRPELLSATPHDRQLMKSDPTYVVEKGLFLRNPLPYHEVRRPFIIGTHEKKWKATIAHRFFEMLCEAGKLRRLFTQNIDGLDYQCTAIPPERVCAVHGSIGRAGCENCGEAMDFEEYVGRLRLQIKDIYGVDETAPKESTPVLCQSCGKPTVKPSTVLFGSSLPASFFDYKSGDLESADLIIVAGTSLVVSPANSIALEAPAKALCVVMDREPVGQSMGMRYRDSEGHEDGAILLQGEVEHTFLQLVRALGWESKLLALPVGSLPDLSQRLLADAAGSASLG